jgi:PIN domain nuclease of toxin-antitoxin system
LLVAQAQTLGVALVSGDRAVDAYELDVLWS